MYQAFDVADLNKIFIIHNFSLWRSPMSVAPQPVFLNIEMMQNASSSSADRAPTGAAGATGTDRAPTAAGPTAGAALGAVVAPAR